jgi:hypothetical protein
MQEKRSIRRKYLLFYSRVYNHLTGELIGHIVDLTPAGVMLFSNTPLETDKVFTLRIELPPELSTRQTLAVDARCIWCTQDIIPAFYDIGFKLTNLSQADTDLITHMVETFGFQDRPAAG